MNTIFKLSDTELDKFIQPIKSNSRLTIRDSLVSGFHVVISSRSITFFLTFRMNTIRKTITLGRYPTTSTNDARIMAIQVLSGMPITKAQLHQLLPALDEPWQSKETIRELLTRYHNSKRLADATKASMNKTFKQGLSDWLDKLAHELTATSFELVYRAMLDRGIESSATMLARYVRAVYRWAELPDPTEKLTQRTGISANRVEAKDRRIEAHQLETFKSTMPTLTDDQQLAITVALTTGMRKSELQSVTAESLDHNTRSIKLAKTKNGKPHTVPLPIELWGRINLKAQDKKPHEPIFNVGDHLPKQFTRAIPLSWHDCRRSCASTMASQGAPEALIKTILNHIDKKNVTQAHYLRFDLEQQREALQKVYEHFNVIS